MLVALFNITAWHLFSAYALLYTGSGRAAIIGYTMPIWASALSVWVLHERIGARQILALALGMGGARPAARRRIWARSARRRSARS